MNRIKHVIWDWNGTLLDDAWLCVEVMNDVLARRSLPALTAARYADVFKFPVRDYYAELGFDFEAESFEVVGTEFIEGYSAREAACDLRPDARAALEGISGAGLTQSVLSASQLSRLTQQAQRLDVHARFNALVGLEDHYAASKIEVGKRWLLSSGVDPERTVLVGDTDHDVEVARHLGVQCLLVSSGHQAPERLRASGAEVAENLGRVLELIA